MDTHTRLAGDVTDRNERRRRRARPGRVRWIAALSLFLSLLGTRAWADPGVADQLPPDQYQALVALYQSTGGASWTNHDGWGDPNATSWYGVEIINVSVDDQGKVIHPGDVDSIVLQLNNLAGPLPSLTALSQLTELILTGNHLTGTLASLSGLTKLYTLILIGNQLTGGLDELSAMPNLIQLDLDSNQLTGSLAPIAGLSSLTSLDLSGNPLTGGLDELSALRSLTYLSLSGTQLTGTLQPLAALTALTELDLYQTLFTGSLDDLASLTQLQVLDLRKNQFAGTLQFLADLTALRQFYASDNQFTGGLDGLKTLTQLRQLLLFNNQLSGDLQPLAGLTQLQQLILNNNQLNGGLSALNALTAIQTIQLSYNEFDGPLPELKGLDALSVLSFAHNELTGDLKPLAAATGLTSLDLSFNRLSGDPTSVEGLPVLQSLVLDDNYFDDTTGSGLADVSAALMARGANAFVAPQYFIYLSNDDDDGDVNQPYSYEPLIKAGHTEKDGPPFTYTSTPLPSGLTLDPATGIISGTPLVAGTFDVGLTVSNGLISSTAVISLTFAASTFVPVITLSPVIYASLGVPASFPITASGDPTKYAAKNLPPGLTFNRHTGIVSGTPTTLGVYTVKIVATNSVGKAVGNINVIVSSHLPEVTVAATRPSVRIGSGGTGEFTVSDFTARASSITVRYKVKGTAVNGTDYTMLTGKVEIPAGSANATVTILPLGELNGGEKRVVKFVLSAGNGYFLSSAKAAKVTILAQ